MRLAFDVYLGEAWLAGLTSVLSIAPCLQALNDPSLELVVVQRFELTESAVAAVAPLVQRVVPEPIPHPAQMAAPARRSSLARRVFNKLDRRASAPPPHLPTDAWLALEVDCVYSSPRGDRDPIPLPSLLWMPDFQHRHLPELFSPDESARRDRQYCQEIASATFTLVTAESVQQDVERFCPESAARTHNLPFVAPVPPALFQQNPQPLLDKYHLPKKYVFMPNQFWKHKNHSLVIQALRILHGRSIHPVVVCAGYPFDHRHPNAFAELLTAISESGVRDEVILLGNIPRAEVLVLMRQAVCLLNPSLFEGFGFSVGESKSIGKRALLSDLPEHREQAPAGATYFNPHDAEELAQKLADIWERTAPGPDLELEQAAREQLPRRQLAFGQAFRDLANEAISLGRERLPR